MKVKKLVEVEVDVPDAPVKVEGYRGLIESIRYLFGDGNKALPPAEKELIRGGSLLDLSHINREGDAAWAVLSALRGPDGNVVDIDQYEVKQATTAVLRKKITPYFPADVASDSDRALTVRKRLDEMARRDYRAHHFVQHAKHAFRVLGLKWDEVNT